jgi:hypothetical protein
MAQRTGKDWRELCAAASEESDADKLLSLVHEILHAFEENDPTPMLPGRPNALATKP